jgi:hypothetical protein
MTALNANLVEQTVFSRRVLLSATIYIGGQLLEKKNNISFIITWHTYLSQHNGFVPTLGGRADLPIIGFKKLNLFPHETLVFGHVIVVPIGKHGDRVDIGEFARVGQGRIIVGFLLIVTAAAR